MKKLLLLPLFSLAMLIGLFAFAEETASDVEFAVNKAGNKAEETSLKEEIPLINAVRAGNAKQVKKLIKSGADVNAKDDEGKTALMWASMYGHNDMIKFLIKNGADVNAKDNNGNTALMFASKYGHDDIVKLLTEAGADANIKNNEGKTAADIAAEREKENNKNNL